MVDKTSVNNLLVAAFGTIHNAVITPAVLVSNWQTTYTFSFIPSHNVVKNGKLLIIFPDDI